MRILFTGASSFTGYWFVRELVEAGHQVIAACRGAGSYEGARAVRMGMVRGLCDTHFDCAFGSDAFLALVESAGHLDVLCHHGAEVGDYRSGPPRPICFGCRRSCAPSRNTAAGGLC